MNTRVVTALAVFVVWVLVTLFGGKIMLGGEEGALSEMVKNGINWTFVVAIAVLLIPIAIFKWRDMHFTTPHSIISTMWFPALLLLGLGSLSLVTGMPSGTVLFFVALNTFFVGVSEETMFRGVLFRAFENSMKIWPAIILTCVLFGGIHTLNGFNTGEWGSAAKQSIAAGMSGMLFIGIVIRTGSLWPAIIYHWLWDCVLFLLGQGSKIPETAPDPAVLDNLGPGAGFLPLLLALPSFLWGLWLLRKVREESYRSSPAPSS